MESDGGSWEHLYVGQTRSTEGVLDSLLKLAADVETRGVIIASTDLSWLFVPL
jgi:hypothetical protein